MSTTAAQVLSEAHERCRLEMTREQLATLREGLSFAQVQARDMLREAEKSVKFWGKEIQRYPQDAEHLRFAESHLKTMRGMVDRFQEHFVVLYQERSV